MQKKVMKIQIKSDKMQMLFWKIIFGGRAYGRVFYICEKPLYIYKEK